MLRHLLGGADRIAVVDTETTGVYPSDRVIEVGVVTLSSSGQVIDRWETLLQPGRDVGPTHIHRITASMLEDAPTFADIVGDLADRIDGAVLAGHNVAFDARLLRAELKRVGVTLDTPHGTLCTLRLTGAKLGVACEQHDVQLDDAHHALADAEASARLLLARASDAEPAGPVYLAGPRPPHLQRVVTREASVLVESPTPPLIVYLADRLAHLNAPPDLMPYLDVLDRAVADLHLDADERLELTDLASDLGLSSAHVAAAHRRLVNDLIDAALDDHVIDDEEYDALVRVAAALQVDQEVVEARTTAHRATATTVRLDPGLAVVFTGNVEGSTRAELEQTVHDWGLETARNVSRKIGLVAAADPSSRSGKAKKARSLGIPVMSVAQLMAAGPGAVLQVETVQGTLRVVECPTCHVTATEEASTTGVVQRVCAGCRQTDTAVHDDGTETSDMTREHTMTVPAGPGMERLWCAGCGREWAREVRRGRKPRYCPDCS